MLLILSWRDKLLVEKENWRNFFTILALLLRGCWAVAPCLPCSPLPPQGGNPLCISHTCWPRSLSLPTHELSHQSSERCFLPYLFPVTPRWGEVSCPPFAVFFSTRERARTPRGRAKEAEALHQPPLDGRWGLKASCHYHRVDGETWGPRTSFWPRL